MGRYNVDHLNLNPSYVEDQGQQQQLEVADPMTETISLGSENLTDHYHNKSPIANSISFTQSESSNHNSTSIESVRNNCKGKTTVSPYWNNDTGWHSNWDQFDQSLWNEPLGTGTDWSMVSSKGSSSSGSKQSGRMEYHDNHDTWKQDLLAGDSFHQRHTVDNNRYRRNNKNTVSAGNEDQDDNIRLKSAMKNSSLCSRLTQLHLDTDSPTSISLSHADRLSHFPASQSNLTNNNLSRDSSTAEYSSDHTDSGTNGTQDIWPIGTQISGSASTSVNHSGSARSSNTSVLKDKNKISYECYGTNFLNQSIWSGDLSLWVNSPSNKKRLSGSFGGNINIAKLSGSTKIRTNICDPSPSSSHSWA